MITDTSRYFGAVFSYIVDRWDGSVAIRKAYEDFAGFYLLNERLPIYIKYSSQRRGPWKFTFHKEHQERQQFLAEVHKECIMIFVCGRDGIVALKHQDFRAVLDENFEAQESVTVRRRHNKMYQIKGRDGVLEKRISRNSLAEALHPMRSRIQVSP
ncbi:MAG: hypothetical protein JJ931_05390 [Henriciella sp.]|nr:hypothetical protein [Henriciella sp.]MBO6694834.1 hypothetical protein [Henriciella sp.]